MVLKLKLEDLYEWLNGIIGSSNVNTVKPGQRDTGFLQERHRENDSHIGTLVVLNTYYTESSNVIPSDPVCLRRETHFIRIDTHETKISTGSN